MFKNLRLQNHGFQKRLGKNPQTDKVAEKTGKQETDTSLLP